MIEVRQLSIDLYDEAIARHRRIVSDVSFSLRPGQGLGVTGESGSGKTTLSLAIGGMLPAESRVTAGSVRWQWHARHGESETHCAGSARAMFRALRGAGTFTLFQEPRASLNPYRTIGRQLERCARHSAGDAPRTENSSTQARVRRALSGVGLDWDIARQYPHEVSTGMCQRVFLAMADLLGARLLIADEPFASVDAQNRERLAKLVLDWKRERGVMVVLVSHELELLHELTDETVVMYRGQVAEYGPTARVLGGRDPVHPYSRLLADLSDSDRHSGGYGASPRDAGASAACCFATRCAWADAAVCTVELPPLRPATPASNGTHQLRCVRHPIPPGAADRPRDGAACDVAAPSNELFRVHEIHKSFRTGWLRRHKHHVLRGVSFSIAEGERLGIHGPSGQGKTTLARIMLGVLPPSDGTIQLRRDSVWTNVSRLAPHDWPDFRRHVQMLYQDADLVFDPASRVADTLVEAYRVFDPRIALPLAQHLSCRLLQELALPEALLQAYPHRLSGGERKRVALARALAALGCPFQPPPDSGWRVLVLDEPTAGVDLFLQAIMARFLLWVQQRLRLSYLVISHHESFVRRFCHRSLRLEHGQIKSSTRHERVD